MPSAPDLDDAIQRVERLLNEWFPDDEVDTTPEYPHDGGWADVRLEWGEYVLIGEYEKRGDVATVARALERLESLPNEACEPLVVVPFMGESGARRCRKAGVHWIDLSGNAHLQWDRVRVHVEGQSNQFKQRGRPSNPFAPKSARVTRFLLAHPHRTFRQKDIVDSTGLGKGYTSKIVRRLEERGLVDRDDQGRVGVAEPSLLLDAWAESYDFSKHSVTKGTIAARDSIELTRRLNTEFEKRSLSHTMTGLSAAWFYTEWARFRTASVYLGEPLSDALKREIGLREDPKGANVWLIRPKDEGVFQQRQSPDGIPCAHPVQVYVDLQAHPERSDEAADAVRKHYLKEIEDD